MGLTLIIHNMFSVIFPLPSTHLTACIHPANSKFSNSFLSSLCFPHFFIIILIRKEFSGRYYRLLIKIIPVLTTTTSPLAAALFSLLFLSIVTNTFIFLGFHCATDAPTPLVYFFIFLSPLSPLLQHKNQLNKEDQLLLSIL